jgi:hypothetical protein
MEGSGFSLLICDDHEMLPNTKLTSLKKHMTYNGNIETEKKGGCVCV